MIRASVKNVINSVGFELRRLGPENEFTVFVRKFSFGKEPFQMWIAHPDSASWYEEAGWEESGEMSQITAMLGPGDRVLEVGSHHGFTGLLCASFVGPTGFVLGIEAHPANAMVAQAQLGLNPEVRNLRFLNTAGSSAVGTVDITSNHNASVAACGSSTIKVAAETGDSLDEKYGPFNVLKIDVEGFELDVLKGCRRILARRPKIALEVHIDSLKKFGATPEDLFREIGMADYTGTCVQRPDFTTVRPFDVAQMPPNGIVNLFLLPTRPR